MNSQHVLSDATLLLAVNVALWLISLPLGKTWPVDFIWSGFPPVLCCIIISRSAFGECARQILVCILVFLWGFRLTQNFVTRGGIGHEDWRYTNMRTQFGANFWWISLFSVFIGQTIFLFAACLPLYGALTAPGALDAIDALGAAVGAGAILLEAVSDAQMDAFQARKREHKTDAVIIDSGLWLWSRHPNYLGELLWWWAVYALGYRTAASYAMVGPLAITLLFVGISVGLLEDRQRANKGAAWEEYVRAVPSSLVLVPPSLGRRLGAWLHGTGGTAMS